MATGQEIYDLALVKNGQQYVLGAGVPKDQDWNGPWDCAELASWAVYRLTSKLYGCTNDHANPHSADAYSGSWKDDGLKLGKKITIEEAASIPGAIVLRAPTDALGGHVAISDGKGGTIEAKGKKWGVTTDVINGRRWDFGVLVPWIDYQTNVTVPVSEPDYTIYRYKSPMMKGDKITDIQQALNNAGFDTKGVDGVFGSNTRDAVMAFQKAHELTIDGEVGKDTAAALKIAL